MPLPSMSLLRAAPRLVALLVVAVPWSVRADDAARTARIRERTVLAADVLRVARLAEACGRRDAAWSARVRQEVITRQAADAERFGSDVNGGAASLRWLMLGARLAADAAADAEFDRYGEAACGQLDLADLAGVDRLLDAPDVPRR